MDIRILNMYASNNTTSKYIKQKLTSKRENKFVIMVEILALFFPYLIYIISNQ